MRKIVALVETLREDGRTIATDAFSLDQEPVPVCWRDEFTRPWHVMGNASELRLQGNELSMEIKLNDRYYAGTIDDFEYYIWADKLVEKDKRVESARIRAITAFPVHSGARKE